jgi:pimeloyl-ACP methyl ester carboxylesterase
MTRFRLAATFVGLLAAAPAAAAPCTVATPQCTERVSVLGGPQSSVVYRSHPLDARNEAITRVLVMIHGAGRNADNYFSSAMAAAFLAGALDNTLVISPRIASNDGAACQDVLGLDEISWHCNTWRSGGPSLSHPAVTSFDLLDEILRKVARRNVFPNVKSIVVAGHSAGGQVVNRYEMTNQVHDSLGAPVTYVVSNPSSYAYPDDARPAIAAYSLVANAPGYIPATPADAPAFRPFSDARNCATWDSWPFGLKQRTGYSAKLTDEQIKTQLAGRPTTVLLGELDILPLGGFDGSCPAMAQGPTRLARGQAYARRVNETLRGKHTIAIVPLCGHNARCIFTSDVALPLIFPGN